MRIAMPARTPNGRPGAPERLLCQVGRAVARLGARVSGALPRRLRGWAGDRVADAAIAIAHLRCVLGPDAPDGRLRRVARSAFRTSVQNMADLLWLHGTDPAAYARTVRLVAGEWAPLDGALAQGRGAVLIAAHRGAFDGLGQVLARRGYRLTIVVGRPLARPIFDAAVALRRAHGVTVVPIWPADATGPDRLRQCALSS